MITATPKYKYNSMYLPFLFELTVNTVDMAYAKVFVKFQGAIVDTMLVPPYQEFGASTVFLVDVQRTLQLRKGTPSDGKISVFPSYNFTPTILPYQQTNTECYEFVSIDVEYYQFQNGLPVLTGTDVSEEYTALLGVRQIEEPENFEAFELSSSQTGKFLTRRASDISGVSTKLTRSQSLYLSFIDAVGINQFQIIALDAQGVPIYTATNVVIGLQEGQKTIGVGLPQLGYPSWTSGTFDPTDKNIKTLLFSVGSVGFFPFSNVQIFDIVDDCKDGLEVLWLNDLGGGESYVFRTETIKEISSKGSFARSPLTENPLVVRRSDSKGRFKFNNTETKVQYKCVSDFLNEVEAEYIKSLLYSMTVYAVIDTEFYQLQVEDGGFIESDNNDFKTQLEITFTRSVDQYSMIR